MPFFGSVMVGDQGDLWVQEYMADQDAPTRYYVFDTDGLQQGLVHLPPRFSPLEIGADYILGQLRDEDDIEFISLYDLRRTS